MISYDLYFVASLAMYIMYVLLKIVAIIRKFYLYCNIYFMKLRAS